MLLTASPSLFDDSTAPLFLTRVQRLMGVMLRTISASPEDARTDGPGLLATDMPQLQTSMETLRARLPAEYRSMFDQAT